jgi:hypothetical protein
MIHQTMSGAECQRKIDAACQKFAMEIRDERLTLCDAHKMLNSSRELDLFSTAGLAKAIACFQCSN